jgi:nicotinamidase/pyrazinamidase
LKTLEKNKGEKMKNQKIHLLAIDCQQDFCQTPNVGLAKKLKAANGGNSTPEIDFIEKGGSLYVQGADQDMVRLANMINRLSNKIDEIHMTLDSHHYVQIFHPIFWIDSKGNHPNPFTMITEEDVVKGTWNTTNPSARKRALEYVRALKANKRYVLVIWPYHTIIGTPGHNIVPCVNDAIKNWCTNRFKKVDYVTKGSNIFTENYSAVQADVIDNEDPTTMLNTTLLDVLAKSDVILLAGEALNFCLANTVTDVANNFGEENIKKFVLLDDCCSNVGGGFEKLGPEFVDRMVKRGMKIAKSDEYLA